MDVSLQLPCTGQRVNRNFASRRALKLPDVAQHSEALWRSVPSWPQHWHIDRVEASFTKLARVIFATVAPPEKRCPKADWITPDTWAVIELHRDCRHLFFARIRQRKFLLLRLAFWAWSPLTFGQAQKARADLAGNRLESALQARFLQLVAKQASKATQADRRSWLRRQATNIQADLDNGVSTSLWSFVRYLSKKKTRKGPKPVVVLRTPQGGIASTPEELAKIWQDTFFREIDRRGEIIPASDYVPFASRMLDTITPPPDVNAPCLLDIYSSTVDAISRVATGRATGPDLIPVELLKAGGSSLCLLLARLFSKVGGHRAPLAWRWGENVPVPKKSDKPLTPDTARGVLLGNAIAKLWAKMIRTELAPHFALQSFAQQLGPSSGGGTHFATQAVKLHMHKTSILKKCGAVVFADLKAAFYRTVLEYVLGGLSDAESTEKLSCKLGLSPQWHCSSEHQLRKARSICSPLVFPLFGLGQQPIGTGVRHSTSQALRTWLSHMLAQSQVTLWLT